MRIDSSAIELASRRLAYQSSQTKESLRAWIGDQRPDFEGEDRGAPPGQAILATTASISREARARLAASIAHAQNEIKQVEKAALSWPEDESDLDPKLYLLKTIVERMTGRKIRILRLEEVRGTPLEGGGQGPGSSTESQPARQGWGVEFDYQRTTTEFEQTDFTTRGIVKTADGTEISFTVNLTMSREYMSEESLSVRAGDAVMKDPLVLNFDGRAARLTDAKFTFDIDADGRQDQVSFVSPGSGFIALDANGDGKINDGSELFGARTGDGFAELASYDADKNGWIDENDQVYGDLRIWTKDGQGTDSLSILKQSGVGAIFLGSAATQFDIKESQNQLLGQVKSTGIYLNEDGTAGTVQQVDLAVAQPAAIPALGTENASTPSANGENQPSVATPWDSEPLSEFATIMGFR